MDYKQLSESKQNLIKELDQRVIDKILEPTNAQLLKKLITRADNDDEAALIAALGTTYKRTGFHFDKRLEPLTSDIRYFKKNEELSFVTDPEKPTHKLIIGDNYEALQNLLIQYRNKIDVIYIDPPYGKDSMGEFAKTNYENAITRDNLLSMLYVRLRLAKELLSDTGVIFCSIDDRNQAYVKCLFDEIFGEKNSLSMICWQANPGGDKGDYLETTLQYIIVYAKNKANIKDLGWYKQVNPNDYPFEDEIGRYKKGGQLEKWGNDDTTHTHPNLAYSIYYNPQTNDVKTLFDYNQAEINANRSLNIVYKEPKAELISNGYFCIRPRITNIGENGRWRIEEKTFFDRLKNKNFIFEKKDSSYRIYEKLRLKERTFIKAKDYISSEISKQNAQDIIDIFGKKVFSYPKPVSLLYYLISIYQGDNVIVLDFFAGSGTTGHAVVDLNRNDGGSRQFILCQLNEKTDTTPNGIAVDVTSKRLKRIMTGTCYDGTNDFAWIKDNTPYGDNLDVYEIATVKNNDSSESKTPFDVIDETLYGHSKISSLREKVEWVCGNFAHTQRKAESDEDWLKRNKEEYNDTGSERP